MDKKAAPIKIYLLSSPILTTEWSALLSDKYSQSLKFAWEFTDQIESADIISWDGVITPKLENFLERITKRLESNAVLLLQGEARTLYENHPFVRLLSLDQLRYVELPGWSILPEEILNALTLCHQKLAHV